MTPKPKKQKERERSRPRVIWVLECNERSHLVETFWIEADAEDALDVRSRALTCKPKLIPYVRRVGK